MADGGIVFVYQDDDALPAVRGGEGLDGLSKIEGYRLVLVIGITSILKALLNMFGERLLEFLERLRVYVVELEVDDRELLPLPVRTVNVESLEQLAPPRE